MTNGNNGEVYSSYGIPGDLPVLGKRASLCQRGIGELCGSGGFGVRFQINTKYLSNSVPLVPRFVRKLNIVLCASCVTLYLGNAQPVRAVTPLSVFSAYTVARVGAGLNVDGVVAGDFNHDGKSDLAGLSSSLDSGSATLSVYLGSADGTMHPGWATSLQVSGSGDLASGDFNADGAIDLVVLQNVANPPGKPSKSAIIMMGKADGTFRQSGMAFLGADGPLLIADLDGDGRLDLIFDGFSNNTILFRGRGDLTFFDPVTLPYAPRIVGDFNGDGIPDIIVDTSTGFPPSPSFPLLYLGTGGGRFDRGHTIAQLLLFSLIVSDFNGDGKLDLADASNPSNLPSSTLDTIRVFFGEWRWFISGSHFIPRHCG